MARRWIALLTVAVCALAAAGCGDKQAVTLHGDTEGTYVDVGPLKYQVQISRLLNPYDPEDKGYLIDLPASQKLGPKDQWFAVFMLVQNNGDKPQRSADRYVIRDTQGNEFRPVTMGTKNVFAYRQGQQVPGEGVLPLPDSPPGQNSIQGSMLLFKIPVADFENRPLELEISSSTVPNTTATIDLDV
jgi:hypothetical protein